MGRFGIGEILLIVIVGLIIFGPSRLPDLGKAFGKAIREFKSGVKSGDTTPPDPPSAAK